MIFWSILSVLLVVSDRVTKFLTVNNLDLGESITVIPKVLDFTYVKNTGAAFSFLADKSWSQLFFKIITYKSVNVFRISNLI